MFHNGWMAWLWRWHERVNKGHKQLTVRVGPRIVFQACSCGKIFYLSEGHRNLVELVLERGTELIREGKVN